MALHRAFDVVDDVRVLDYVAHPLNWRIHPDEQRTALRESLAKFGLIDLPLVNKRTKHILDGHLRFDDARDDGHETIPCAVIDVDEATEDEILAMFDHVTGMAEKDDATLLTLLEKVREESHTLPPGYDAAYLDQLRTVLDADREADAKRRRQKEQADTSPEPEETRFVVLVELENEEDQVALLERLTEEGYNCRSIL
jgi:hypothetical protein